MSNVVEDPLQPAGGKGVDDANKFFLGARSALKIGDMRAAERLLRRALELSPDDYNYKLALARLLVQADKDPSEAEQLLFDSNHINITAVEPRLILAAMYEKMGRRAPAQAVLKGVLNIDPTNFIARRKLNQLNVPLAAPEELEKVRNELLTECSTFVIVPPTAKLPRRPDLEAEFATDSETAAESVEQPVAETIESTASAKLADAVDEIGNTTFTYSQEEETEEATIAEAAAQAAAQVAEKGPELVKEEEIVNQATDDLEVASYMASVAMVEAIKEEIMTQLPAFAPEGDLPEFEAVRLHIDFDELGEPIASALVELDVRRVLELMREFYFAVEEEVGRETTFLLLMRAKIQIESLYPALDSFEIIEGYKIIDFLSTDTFITPRTLEALTTWMYLFITLLGETALDEAASTRARERAIPKNGGPEAKMFIEQFNAIRI